MIIEQTVEIPANHRLDLHIDIPPEFPAGRTILTFTPASSDLFAADKAKSTAAPRKRRIPIISWIEDRRVARQTRVLLDFYGCLANNPAFAGDPVEMIRKERDSWDERLGIHETNDSL